MREDDADKCQKRSMKISVEPLMLQLFFPANHPSSAGMGS